MCFSEVLSATRYRKKNYVNYPSVCFSEISVGNEVLKKICTLSKCVCQWNYCRQYGTEINTEIVPKYGPLLLGSHRKAARPGREPRSDYLLYFDDMACFLLCFCA